MTDTPDSFADTPRRARRFPLEHPSNRYKVIQQLAQAERTQVDLAAEYGVGQPAIAEFKKRHMPEIERAREKLAEDFSALWIANKAARLAEYQVDVESVNDAIEPVETDEGVEYRLDPQLLGVKHKALRQVAEELGQLPNRVDMQVDARATIRYEIAGVDMSTLQ